MTNEELLMSTDGLVKDIEKKLIILDTLEVLHEEGCITTLCYNEKKNIIINSLYENKYFKLIHKIEKKINR